MGLVTWPRQLVTSSIRTQLSRQRVSRAIRQSKAVDEEADGGGGGPEMRHFLGVDRSWEWGEDGASEPAEAPKSME